MAWTWDGPGGSKGCLTNGYDQDNATPRKPKCKIQTHPRTRRNISAWLQGWAGMSGLVDLSFVKWFGANGSRRLVYCSC